MNRKQICPACRRMVAVIAPVRRGDFVPFLSPHLTAFTGKKCPLSSATIDEAERFEAMALTPDTGRKTPD